MKLVYGVLLLVSIAYPVYAVFEMLAVTAHNQWHGRERNMAIMDRSFKSAHLGLSGAELAVLEEQDKLAADAYRHAVQDGIRLGYGHGHLWNVSLGLNALLFIACLGGLWLCRQRRCPTAAPTDEESSAAAP